MDKRGIPYIGHTWGRPGKDKELEDYICCSFIPHWGMLSKETEAQAVLELSPDLIWRRGTLFCPGNTASNEFSLSGLRDNNTVDALDAMFDNPYTGFPTPYQCEILVYREIILAEHLNLIHFREAEDLEYGEKLIVETLDDPTVAEKLEVILPIKIAVSSHLYPRSER
jgi:hypothetical protein